MNEGKKGAEKNQRKISGFYNFSSGIRICVYGFLCVKKMIELNIMIRSNTSRWSFSKTHSCDHIIFILITWILSCSPVILD